MNKSSSAACCGIAWSTLSQGPFSITQRKAHREDHHLGFLLQLLHKSRGCELMMLQRQL
jgi:hypothetical protein